MSAPKFSPGEAGGSRAAFALVDHLMRTLVAKGILTASDVEAIVADSLGILDGRGNVVYAEEFRNALGHIPIPKK